MNLNKEALSRAEQGMKFIQSSKRNAYIGMSDDSKHVEYIVELGNSYYCGSNVEQYVYWDGSSYGFTFTPELFAGEVINE